MKKIVLNISDSTFEKLRFESILQKKGVSQLIEERLMEKPFSPETIEAFEKLMQTEINKIMNEQ